MKSLIALLLLAIPYATFAQKEWKAIELDLIKRVADYRAHLLESNRENVLALKYMFERWSEFEPNIQEQTKYIEQIRYERYWYRANKRSNRRIINSLKVAIKSPLNKAVKEYDIDLVANNSELIDLILEGVLDPFYPYKIEGQLAIYKELEFYELKEKEHIGEISAGSGMFGILMRMIDKKLKIILHEINVDGINYIAKKIVSNEERVNSSDIRVVRGNKDHTNFPNNTLDKIIIRNDSHLLITKKDLLRSIKNSLKKNGVLYLREFKSNLVPCQHFENEIDCQKRMTEDKMKDILKENGFRLEKEFKIQGIILHKYTLLSEF